MKDIIESPNEDAKRVKDVWYEKIKNTFLTEDEMQAAIWEGKRKKAFHERASGQKFSEIGHAPEYGVKAVYQLDMIKQALKPE